MKYFKLILLGAVGMLVSMFILLSMVGITISFPDQKLDLSYLIYIRISFLVSFILVVIGSISSKTLK